MLHESYFDDPVHTGLVIALQEGVGSGGSSRVGQVKDTT